MFVIWYDLAIPSRAVACCGIPVMSAPLNQMRPEVGTVSPEIRRKKVVLPAPLGPMIERSSPRWTLTSTSDTASNLPYARVRRSVRSKTASGIAGECTGGFTVSRHRACAKVPRGRLEPRGGRHGPSRGAHALEERDDRDRIQGLRVRPGVWDRPDGRHRCRQLRAHRRHRPGGGTGPPEGALLGGETRAGHREREPGPEGPSPSS